MYQQKYSAEESLKRIKLMMEYDLSKTSKENLQENKILLREQAVANAVSDADLLGSTNKFRQWYQFWSDYGVFNAFGFNPMNFLAGGRRTGVKGAVDALDGFVDTEDLQHVMALIKALDGKCYFDDVEGKNISATERFLQLYQEDEGEDLKDDVNSVGTSTLTTGAEKIKRQIIKLIDTQVAKGCAAKTETTKDDASAKQQHINNIWCSVKGGVITAGGRWNGKKWDEYVKGIGGVSDAELDAAKKSCKKGENSDDNRRKGGGKSSFTACSGEYKRGCKSDVIKKVQACLGMAGKYQTGNFGPITQAELKKLGKGFENGFKDADVDIICTKQPVKPAGVEDLEDETKANSEKPF